MREKGSFVISSTSPLRGACNHSSQRGQYMYIIYNDTNEMTSTRSLRRLHK